MGETPRLLPHTCISISVPVTPYNSHLCCVCRYRRVYKVHQDVCYKESCESTGSEKTTSRYSLQLQAERASLPVAWDRRMQLAGVTQHMLGCKARVDWERGAGTLCRIEHGECTTKVVMPALCALPVPHSQGAAGLMAPSSIPFQKTKQQSHTEEAIE